MASGTGNLPHTSMSFSPFAILTAEELNDLVDNIEALAGGSGIGDGAIAANRLAAGAALGNLDSSAIAPGFLEIGRTTLSVAGDTITVSGLPARKYLKVLFMIKNSGAISASVRFNNDSTSRYGWRYIISGGSEVGTAPTTQILLYGVGGVSFPIHGSFEAINVANMEKVIWGIYAPQAAAGSSTAPVRVEHAGKWVNTSDQINRLDFINLDSGDFAVGSQIIVLGKD